MTWWYYFDLFTRLYRLQACKDDGSLEDQVIEFSWDTINTFELEEEGMSFMFQYRRAGKPDRWVRIYSQFYVFLFECFEKIQEEIGWSKQIEEQGKEVERFWNLQSKFFWTYDLLLAEEDIYLVLF